MKKFTRYVKYANQYQRLHISTMYIITRKIKNNHFVMTVRLGVNLNKEAYVYAVKRNLDLIILSKWFNLVTFLRFVKNVGFSAVKKI